MSTTLFRLAAIARSTLIVGTIGIAACTSTRTVASSAPGTRIPFSEPEMSGPTSWRRQTVPSTASCRSLSAVDAMVAWAGCTTGHVFHTIDGGTTWTADSVAGAARLDFRGIKAFDAYNAVVSSAGPADSGQARIYRTIDGGKTWSLTWSDTTKGVFLDGIAFWDSKHGFTFSDPVGGRLVILTTDDGGLHWTRTPPSNIPLVLANEAAFAASNTQLAVQGSSNAWIATGGGAEARVFRSTDRGHTWRVSPAGVPGGASAGLFGIAFADAKHGLAVGGDYAIRRGPSDFALESFDGGINWKRTATRPDGTTQGLALIPMSIPPAFVAVGAHGSAFTRDFGATWSYGDTNTVWGVGFAGPNTGWAAGARGRVMKFGIFPAK